jgi:hypothetical protein
MQGRNDAKEEADLFTIKKFSLAESNFLFTCSIIFSFNTLLKLLPACGGPILQSYHKIEFMS